MAIRDARRKSRSLLVTDTDHTRLMTRTSLQSLGFEGVLPRREDPSPGSLLSADVQRAAFNAFGLLAPEAKAWVGDNLMTDELEGTVRDRAEVFYKTAFFKRIFEGTLTRTQYIESVANNHQFVRWTTRLLARLVAMTADQKLRRHYVEHLNGEIDHDVLLENDLRYLGSDPEYVRNHMVPCREIQQFMVVQESAIGFHQNPVVALGVPFAIESATALMDVSFIEALRKCIGSWGYSTPGRGCTFLASHIKTDGGEDGHWEGTKRMLRMYMRDETTLQKTLNVSNLVMDGVIRAYEAYGLRPSLEHLQP
jgi:pyrroloquinoline quinone (PQQ) biosynthesis protein C